MKSHQNLKRYRHIEGNNHCGISLPDMEEHLDGEWVRYDELKEHFKNLWYRLKDAQQELKAYHTDEWVVTDNDTVVNSVKGILKEVLRYE